jgi:hypothetical protein
MATVTMQFPSAVGDEDFVRIENALRQLSGVTALTMQRPIKEVTVQFEEPTTWNDVHRAVSDLGYVPDVSP